MAQPKSKYREISVKNSSNRFCLIQASDQQSNLTEQAYSQAIEQANATSKSSSKSNENSGSVEFSGAVYSGGASYSQKNAQSDSSSNSHSNKASSSGSWKKAFSPFLSAGFVQVKPGKTKAFAVEGERCFISVAVLEGEPIFIANWSTLRSKFEFDGEDLDTVEETKKPPPKQKVESQKKKVDFNNLVNGSAVKIHGYDADESLFVGNPKDSWKNKYVLGNRGKAVSEYRKKFRLVGHSIDKFQILNVENDKYLFVGHPTDGCGNGYVLLNSGNKVDTSRTYFKLIPKKHDGAQYFQIKDLNFGDLLFIGHPKDSCGNGYVLGNRSGTKVSESRTYFKMYHV